MLLRRLISWLWFWPLTCLVLLCGSVSGQTFGIPASLSFQSWSAADALPSHWYFSTPYSGSPGEVQAGGTGGATAANVFNAGWIAPSGDGEQWTSASSNYAGDGAIGAGSAGVATNWDIGSAILDATFKQTGQQISCTLAQVPEIDGCGYERFVFCVIFKDVGASTNYYGQYYIVTHGRNGYVSWTTMSSTTNTLYKYYTSTDGINWVGSANQVGYAPKFPGKAALLSVLNNPNGLLLYGFPISGTAASTARGTIAGLAGSAADTRCRAELGLLQSSLTAKQDMTGHIPRCSGQDVESSGGGGGSSVDHVGDAAATVPSNADFDGDGVPDYLDVLPQSNTLGSSGPATSVMWVSGSSVVPTWDMSSAGLGTMRSDQFPSLVLPWRKPTLGGDVPWLSSSVDCNPASNPVSGVAGALDTLRVLCRTLGTLFVVLWSMHGVLITFRQW